MPTYKYKEPIALPNPEQQRKPVKKEKKKKLLTDKYLLVYPNPACDYLTIDYSLNEKVAGLKLVITDILGKTFFEKELFKDSDQFLINP